MQKIDFFSDYKKSRFYKRLEKTKSHELLAVVQHVATKSKDISKLIIRYMPQYTLHDETHILNVLSYMDTLVPAKTMSKLSPLECAFCIMAAYIHDLGMALSEKYYLKFMNSDTPEAHKFQSFKIDKHPALVKNIEHWQKEFLSSAIPERREELRKMMEDTEAFLLSEYLRANHALNDGPVKDWLKQFEGKNTSLFVFNGYNYRDLLANIAISHGHQIEWMEDKLDKPLIFAKTKVFPAFSALLLRLGDIMDFDASRTPEILFRNLGITNDYSIKEWHKHMAISGIGPCGHRKNLVYSANACTSPVYEKAIRNFIETINAEIRHVRYELDRLKKILNLDWRYDLELPEKVTPDITPITDNDGKPSYIYHDVEFNLDQHSIMALLMGTNLYGHPAVCIRELLQNSLDAVMLRDMRLKLKQKERLVHVDDWEEECNGEETPKIILSWGKDESGEFLQVTDYGAGMNREQIVKYFTRIGRSFYTSPEFEREKRLFAENGFPCSAISQFGIGILSCFMIADRIEVRTRPGGNVARPLNISVSGPDSLFWFRTGNLPHQGTEIKLFLKQNFTIVHDYNKCIEGLRKIYDLPGIQEEYNAEDREFDPAFVALKWCPMPQYPIKIIPQQSKIETHRFLLENTIAFDIGKINAAMGQTEQLDACYQEIKWLWYDWTDQETGSRIRLCRPAYKSEQDFWTVPDKLPPSDLLAACCEAQLSRSHRIFTLIKGMYAGKVNSALLNKRIVDVAPGTLIFFDLRGDAAPHMKADRSEMIPIDEQNSKVKDSVARVFENFEHDILDRQNNETAVHLALSLYSWCKNIREKLPQKIAFSQSIQFPLRQLGSPEGVNGLAAATRVAAHLEQDIVLSRLRVFARDPDFNFDFDFDFDSVTESDNDLARARTRDLTSTRDLARPNNIARVHDRARDIAFTNARDLARGRARDLARDLARAMTIAQDIASTFARDIAFDLVHKLNYDRILILSDISSGNDDRWQAALQSNLLSEAFQPSLRNSLPLLKLYPLDGRIEDFRLLGPAVFDYDLAPDDNKKIIPPVDTSWVNTFIREKEFDLVFPLTAIPLGRLRDIAWENFKTERFLRNFLVYPFFDPDAATRISMNPETIQAVFDLIPGIRTIHVLMPDEKLWNIPFDEWIDENWQCDCMSGLWNISAGTVKWLTGAESAAEIIRNGVELEELY